MSLLLPNGDVLHYVFCEPNYVRSKQMEHFLPNGDVLHSYCTYSLLNMFLMLIQVVINQRESHLFKQNLMSIYLFWCLNRLVIIASLLEPYFVHNFLSRTLHCSYYFKYNGPYVCTPQLTYLIDTLSFLFSYQYLTSSHLFPL